MPLPRLASSAFGARICKLFSTRLVAHALKVLDGFDDRQVPRYADFMKTVPANIAIDKGALEHDKEIEKKQDEWLRNSSLKQSGANRRFS